MNTRKEKKDSNISLKVAAGLTGAALLTYLLSRKRPKRPRAMLMKSLERMTEFSRTSGNYGRNKSDGPMQQAALNLKREKAELAELEQALANTHSKSAGRIAFLKDKIKKKKVRIKMYQDAYDKLEEKQKAVDQSRYNRKRLSKVLNDDDWTSWGRMSGAPMGKQVMVTYVPPGYFT